METVGYSPVLVTNPPKSKSATPDKLFLKIQKKHPSVDFGWLTEYAKHVSAVNDTERYYKSLKKCDVLPKKPAGDDPCWLLAQEYTYQMLSAFCQDAGASKVVDFNKASSNGTFYNKMINPETGKPFKNKGEFLDSKVGRELVDELYDPLVYVSGKKEFLPEEEVNDGKMRTFFVCDTPFVIKQKLMYDKMDEKMLQNATNYSKCWSRYGYVKQYGGIHDLAEAHMNYLKHRKRPIFHKMSDVSGWDRVLSVMEEIYKCRARLFGKMTERERQWHELIIKNLLSPFCVLHNGQIIKRKTGNCSGSGKTTTDNTIGHIMIEMYTYIAMYYEKHGEFPTYDFIMQNVMESLYGDDDFGSLILDDWVPDEISELQAQIQYYIDKYKELYLRFGLVIKEKAFNYCINTVEDLEFLGSTFKWNPKRNRWVGQSRISKVASTLLYSLDGDRDVNQYVSILEAILSLTHDVPTVESERIHNFMSIYASAIMEEKGFLDLPSNLIKFVTSVVSGTFRSDQIVHGYEGNSFGFFDRNVDNFFYQSKVPRREEVGFKTRMENFKGQFLEYSQRTRTGVPSISCTTSGPDHLKKFILSTNFRGKFFFSEGYSKKEAEQKLYRQLLHAVQTPLNYRTTSERFSEENPDIYSFPTGEDDDDFKLPTRVSYQPKPKPKMVFYDDAEEYKTVNENLRKHGTRVAGGYFCDERESVAFFHELGKCLIGLPSKIDRDFLDYFKSIEDPGAIATWLHTIFKEGGFNPYGNGQTSQWVISTPEYKKITPLIYTCSSTCLLPTAVTVVGSGATQTEAFADWLSQIEEYLGALAPVEEENAKFLYSIVRGLTSDDLRITSLQKLEYKEGYNAFKKTFFEGSFNPYGNGQPLSKSEWMKMNKTTYAGKSKAEKEAAYQRYVKRAGKTTQAVRQMVAKNSIPVPPSRSKPLLKDRATGVEKRSEVKLSGCARSYAVALRCPFWWKDRSCDVKVRSLKVPDGNPCIPMFPAVKTRKFWSIASGFFGSTDGTAPYVVFAPHRLGNTGTLDNVNPPVISSGGPGSISFPIVDTGVAIPAGANGTWMNTDYTQASLVNGANQRGVRFRVVGAGLRVKYTGNMLNAAGMFVCVEQPNHLSLSGLTIVDASKLDSYFTVSVDNSITTNPEGWIYLTYTPVDVNDFEFEADPMANNLWPNDPIRNHFMGILVPGAPIGATLFEWEAIIHYEVVGVFVTGKTATPADPIGTATVVNSIDPSSQKTLNTNEHVKSALSEGVKDLTTTVTNLVPKNLVESVVEAVPKLLL